MSEYWGIFRRHLALIAVMVVLGGAATTAYVLRQPTRYDAVASVQIYNLSSPLQTRGGQSDLTRAMLTQIAIIHGDAVRTAVRAIVGSAPPVHVQPAGDADVLNITANAGTAARAAKVANAYAAAYVYVGRQRAQDLTSQLTATLTAQEEALQAQISALDAQLAQGPSSTLRARRAILAAQLAGLIASSNDATLRTAANTLQATVIRSAQPPAGPHRMPRAALILSGALIALLLGFAVACVIETAQRRRRQTSGEDAPANVPVFGPVAVRRLHPLERGRSRQVRRMVAELTRAGAFSNSVVQLTGTAEGDAVAAVAVELAVSLADSGSSVLVVDCDFIRPQLHQLCEVRRSPGLSEVLSRAMQLPDAVNVYRCGEADIHVISAGAPGGRAPTAAALREFVPDALARYDVVLLVSPPQVIGARRVAGLPAVAGATVVVTNDADGSKRTTVRAAVDALRDSDLNVAAVVRVDARQPHPQHRGRSTAPADVAGATADLHE